MSKTKFLGSFVSGNDTTTRASDEAMVEFFGDNWENIPFVTLVEKLNEKLLPLNRRLDFVPGEGYNRTNIDGDHHIFVFTSIRQTLEWLNRKGQSH